MLIVDRKRDKKTNFETPHGKKGTVKTKMIPCPSIITEANTGIVPSGGGEVGRGDASGESRCGTSTQAFFSRIRFGPPAAFFFVSAPVADPRGR